MLQTICRLTGLTLSLILFLNVSAPAQDSVQSPSEYLGYDLGTEWTPHYKVMNYFEHVANNSPMVRMEEYGETNEGRKLLLAQVTSEGNMNRLEELRTNNLKRAGLLEGVPTENTTAIVWLSYNVHGNETSSSEAAMKTIYELVQSDNGKAQQWLQNTIVLIDPMLNPDGRDRYVYWYKQTVGEQPDVNPDSREHHEPWPGGRTNHYYFDLNRDWAWLTQKESRARIKKFQEWLPHVHVDFHEQYYDSPYYFAPAAKPFHGAITDWQSEFQYTIGKNNAGYFNENNWLYFTRESFDLFYPSYGDTYPIFNGSIGMTYEQAGHSRAGLGILKAEGDTLKLEDRLIHHFTTGLATIETASQNATQLVEEFATYYEEAQTDPQGKYKSYVIKGDNNPDKIRALLHLLDQHKVEYGKTTATHTVGGYNYLTGDNERLRVTPNDYVVNSSQPKSVMARVLFEPHPQLEDSVTYDITSWEQHYAYGLEGYALRQQLDITPASAPQPEVDNTFEGTPYAYLVRWEDAEDVRLLSQLLQNEIKIRYAQKPFEIEGKEYQSGTLIITRRDNIRLGKKFDERVQKIATNLNQNVDAVNTGFVESGADFGSSSVRYLKKPKAALLSGEGTSSGMVGEIWHFFDKQIDYPLHILDISYFNRVDLSEYDVLILPEGRYRKKLGEDHFKEILKWVRSGGKLIALGGANDILAGKDGFSLKKKENEKEDGEELLKTYGEQERENISDYNAGSIFRITMDTTHPLAYGYRDDYFSLKLSGDAYEYLDDGWNVGVTLDDAKMSGFAGYRVREQLNEALTFGVQEIGSGTVVYMVDNPLFRAFWYNGKLLMGNALFLVGN
jgi:hypothetical protein